MDFDRSTQARSWIFDHGSLSSCRKTAVSGRSLAKRVDGTVKVRKGASGYARRHAGEYFKDSSSESSESPQSTPFDPCAIFPQFRAQAALTSKEQDVLVRFHAHQITMLIGPDAILPQLVRTPTVLATAIMFFRRFYLSNSVLDFAPRRLAVAAAFLASKVEEQRVEIDVLEHATDLIQQKVKAAPLCRQELCYVTVDEIEVAERDLMEGLNYEMRCHHPYNAIRVLAGEVEKFRHRNEECKFERRRTSQSKPSVVVIRDDEFEESVLERASMFTQNALLFSDVPFLFPPGQIAFAAVAMSMRGKNDGNGLPLTLRTYLRDRFTSKTEGELLAFEEQVSAIVDKLLQSPVMDVRMIELSQNTMVCDRVVAEQADELRRVFHKVTNIRCSPRSVQQSPIRELGSRKRLRAPEQTMLSPERRLHRKYVKVTPTKL